jgi:ABC-type bacteriocin/lantibiotic exporter with double-glycine peptidase domain
MLALIGKDMQVVIQEEVTGCGIAASAALAGLSYAEATKRANALGIYASDTSLWSDTEYVRKLLRDCGVSVSPKQTPFESWERLPDKALLAIKWRLEQGRPFWHWVLFVREEGQEMVLDSKKALRSNVRQDFGRIKPKWYIEITN